MLRRHTKLRTYKPLRARKPMRQRRDRQRRSSRVRDEAYLDHIRELPCCCPTCHGRGHQAPSDPHHPRHERGGGPIGAGRKADDDRAIPLSRKHHDLIQHHQGEDQRTGPWAGWSTERVQAWHDEQADIHRARYLATREGTP